ncbi:DUF2723 domain-containing protein [candidate division WOR-3 bacterium]|nr:DUF2723 domain-containing protein [candidate division WOR-3 bacterium]
MRNILRSKGPDMLVMSGVFVFLFANFAITSSPSISWWDSSELVAAAHCWGVPHPPGSPLYVTAARVFCMFAEDPALVARCVNFLSVTATALAGVFLYLSIAKLFGAQNLFRKFSLSIAAVCGTMCFSMWDSAVEAEIYGLSSLMIFVLLWLSLKITEGKPKYLIGASYLLALSFSVHATVIIAGIPVLAAAFFAATKKVLRPSVVVLCLIFVLVGASSYMILYFRGLEKPVLNESAVENFRDLADVALRKQYGSQNFLHRQTSTLTGYSFLKGLFFQNVSYLNYMAWQFTPFVREGKFGTAGVVMTSVFMALFFLFFVFSLIKIFRGSSPGFLVILLLFMFCLSFLLVFVFNFKFCSSDSDLSHIPKEARARDYFFSAGFALIYALALSLLSFMRKKKAVPLLLFFTLSGLYNGYSGHANRRDSWSAHAFAFNVLGTAQGKSVIFVHGDNDTFTLWFAQIVGNEKKFDKTVGTGVVVINSTLLNLPWYMDEISEKIPFELSKVYGNLFDEIDLTGKDIEAFCRENALAVKNTDGIILYPSDVAVRCILSEIYERDYSLATVAMSDSSFSEFILGGKSGWNVYSTLEMPLLEGFWQREGLLLKLFGDSRKNRALLLGYDYKGIIKDDCLDELGRIKYFREITASQAFKRDVDSRAMAVFYERALEILCHSDSLYISLYGVFSEK